MSFFRGRSQPAQAAQLPTYTGLQLPTATSTLPIPCIWGRTKCSVNVIFYDGFTAVPELSRENRGGKGGVFKGGGGGYQIVGWFYLADLQLALCEGPIDGIGNVFKGQAVFPFTQMGVSLFVGDDAQVPFSPITSKYPGRSLAYKNTAYLGCMSYNLGSSAALGSLNLEVKGLLYGTGFNGEDADPGELILDFLLSPTHGAYYPEDEVMVSDLVGASGDSSVQSYCWAMGLALSPNQAQFEPANSILTRWLRAINVAPFVSQGILRFIPYGDEPVSGNGSSWVLPEQSDIELGEDDFVILSDDQDPVDISIPDPLTLPTVLRAEVLQRGEDGDINQYQPISVEARDLSQTVGYGQRVGSSDSFHEICEVDMGAQVVQTLLQRERYAQKLYSWFLDWLWVDLDPMDIVYLTSSKVNLYRRAVRIRKIEEDEEGIFHFIAEEFTPGVSTPGPNPSLGTIPTSVNTAVEALPVNAILIFESPSEYNNAFNGGIPQLWFGASGGTGGSYDPNWGGCYVHASVDGGTSYEPIAKVVAPLAQGALTSGLALATGFDTTNTLAVDLTESGQNLETITDATAQSGGNLSLVNSELICFATATLTGSNTYNLTRMQRGMYGTTAALHTTGASFAQLDNVTRTDLPSNYVGQPLKFKFQSFNKWGGGLQELSTCTPYDYTPTGAGQGGVQVATIGETITPANGATSALTSIQIPKDAIVLSVTVENVTTIIGNADLTGYSVDPVFESDGTINLSPYGEFIPTAPLTNGATTTSSFASKQWQVATALVISALGTGSPQFTGSGDIRVSVRYMTF